MAKVGVKIGITMKLFKDSNYEFIRPEISIEEIDTEGNVSEQINKAIAVSKEAFSALEGEMQRIVEEQAKVMGG